MNPRLERLAFVVLYVALGGTLLYFSIWTFIDAGVANPHIAILAGIEALGAALLLIPRTQRVGGVLLLLTLLIAFLVHARHGSYHLDLVIYAVATWYVMVRGGRGTAP
jgi:glucose-6-phosphate-specific signal transduction histidine kinase